MEPMIKAPSADEKPEPGMKKEEVDAAMDGLRKELREAEEARRANTFMVVAEDGKVLH